MDVVDQSGIVFNVLQNLCKLQGEIARIFVTIVLALDWLKVDQVI